MTLVCEFGHCPRAGRMYKTHQYYYLHQHLRFSKLKCLCGRKTV
jgi:hypothetical protein